MFIHQTCVFVNGNNIPMLVVIKIKVKQIYDLKCKKKRADKIKIFHLICVTIFGTFEKSFAKLNHDVELVEVVPIGSVRAHHIARSRSGSGRSIS